MKRSRYVLTAVAAVATASLALTACSGSGGSDDGSVTLTLWHNTQDPQAVLDMYAAYEEESGNTLELIPITSDGFEDATLTKWASGDRPDILEFHATSDYIAQLNPAENLNDLSDMDFIERSGGLYDLGGRGPDGNVYAAITNFPEVWGMYYNKGLLSDNGFEPATTFDELLDQCETFTAAGVTTLSEAGGSFWPLVSLPLLFSSSAAPDGWSQQIIDQETALDASDSPLLGAVENYQELLDAGCTGGDITTATFENSVDHVYNGEAVYQAIHSNIAPVYLDAAGGDAEALGDAVGFTALGDSEETVLVNPGPIGSYFLPKTGDDAKEAAAREFIEFATGDYNQTYVENSATFPILDGIEDPSDVSPLMLDIKAAYDEVPQVNAAINDVPAGSGALLTLMSELVVGQTTPQELVKSAQQSLSSAAGAQGLPGW